MTDHQLSKYVAPYGPPEARKPGIAVCTCTASLEDKGLTKRGAHRWLGEHPHHVDSGARDLRPVLEHDFAHVGDVAQRVEQLALIRFDMEDADAADAVYQAAQAIETAVHRGLLSDLQLLALEDVPALFGDVLSSIDPERAR